MIILPRLRNQFLRFFFHPFFFLKTLVSLWKLRTLRSLPRHSTPLQNTQLDALAFSLSLICKANVVLNLVGERDRVDAMAVALVQVVVVSSHGTLK